MTCAGSANDQLERDVSSCVGLGHLELLPECGPRAAYGTGSSLVEADNAVLDGGGNISEYWRERNFGGGG